MNEISKKILVLVAYIFAFAGAAFAEDISGNILDIVDPLLDDRGPGYYQYPLDRRIKRGTYDLKRFSVHRDGGMVVFTIQMRDYIMTSWPDGKGYGEEQGFVALLGDIYIDLDGRPGSGFNKALPGRSLEFSENMGWEKMILITPLSQYTVWDELKSKSDDALLIKMIPDIITPDYIEVQRDKMIIRINAQSIGDMNEDCGFQCFIMGFSPVVSMNQLWNRDVRGFASTSDFGGGWDTHGDPCVIDMIVPEGHDQYEMLKQYKSEPFQNNIRFACVPFVTDKINKKKEIKVIKATNERNDFDMPFIKPPEEKPVVKRIEPVKVPVRPVIISDRPSITVKPGISEIYEEGMILNKTPVKKPAIKTSSKVEPEIKIITETTTKVKLKAKERKQQTIMLEPENPIGNLPGNKDEFKPLVKPVKKQSDGFVPIRKNE
ncbi:MAG: hypothetical protein HQM10_19440 [Candidatus Riflebacteria bacterium]|nr:hypothetical protein [Candidatus Riflebacteria bacterium]